MHTCLLIILTLNLEALAGGSSQEILLSFAVIKIQHFCHCCKLFKCRYQSEIHLISKVGGFFNIPDGGILAKPCRTIFIEDFTACPLPCSAILALLLSSCCNQEAACRISSPVRFKHEAELISLPKSSHMWALAPPWQIRWYGKDISETWDTFYTHCHCDFCHVLEVPLK